MKRVALLLLVLLVTVPFLKKPFHIDDVYFLEISRNIIRTPWDPFSGAVTLLDSDFSTFRRLHETPNTFEAMSHPPLVPITMTLITVLTGSTSELSFHLAFLVFPLLCAFSMHSLAKRFSPFPTAATVFLLLAPAFVVNAHNVMTDIPMLAFSLAALALFVSGADQEDRRKLILAGIFAGLAMLTRYVAVLLIPLFAAYTLVHKKKWSGAAFSFAAAAIVFGAWCVQNLAVHGQLHVIASARYYAAYYTDYSFRFKDILAKLVSDLAGLGGTEVILIALLIILFARVRSLVLCVISLAASALLVVVNPFGIENLASYSTPEKSLLVFFVALGVLLLLLVLVSGGSASESTGSDKEDRRFLSFWLLLTFAGAVVVLPFGTVRYMIPVLPPALLLAARRLKNPSRAAGAWATVAAVLMLASGLVLGAVDFQFAEAYKQQALSLNDIRSHRWFIGEWGFRYYMEENGGTYLLSTNNSPVAGDVIVRPRIAGQHEFSPDLRARIRLRETKDIYGRLPVCLLNPEAKAGFYAHGFGFLPFAFCSTPVERFDIYDVIR